MGEQFIKKHTEQFQHQQDMAFQKELVTCTLFSSRPEVYDVEYPCRLLASCSILEGDQVLVQGHIDGKIEIVCANQVIGAVEGTAAAQLHSILQSDTRAGGMIKAKITSFSQLSDGFKIRCVEEGSFL